MNRLRIFIPLALIIILLLASPFPLVHGQPQGYVLICSPPRGYQVDWMDVKALYMKAEGNRLYFYVEYYGAIPSSRDYRRVIRVYIDTDRNPQTGRANMGVGEDYYIAFGLYGDNSFSGATLNKWDSMSNSWNYNIKDLTPNARRAPGLSYMEIWVDKQDIGYTQNGIDFYVESESYVKAIPMKDLSYLIGSLVKQITVDGEPGDWGSIAPSVTFPSRGINPPELEASSIYVANDGENLYFRLDTRGKPTTTVSGGVLYRSFYVHLDTDNNGNTGYTRYGGAEFYAYADFSAIPSKYTWVDYYRYTGTGSDWSWQKIGSSSNSSDFNNVFEFKTPLSLLGLGSGQTIGIHIEEWWWRLERWIPPSGCLTYPPALRDTTPPVTAMAFGEPKHQVGSTTYVSGSTVFTLSASDAGGVKETRYRVDNGPWTTCSAGFTLLTLSDGEHIIGYYSIDNAGNTEAEKTITVVLDKTPPVTTMALSGPMYQVGSTTYVSTSTGLTLSSADNASGVKETKYRVDDDPWNIYITGLTFTSLSEGSHTISYYSIDNVNNTETEKTLTIILDKTPPAVSEASPTGTISSTSVSFTVKVEDSGSGVKEVRLIVDGASQGLMSVSGNTYTMTVSLSEGSHTWAVEAVDNVGNTATQSYSLTVSTWMSLLPYLTAIAIVIVIIAIVAAAIMLRRRKPTLPPPPPPPPP